MKNLILLIVLIITPCAKLFSQYYNCYCIDNERQVADFERKLTGEIFISALRSLKTQYFYKWTEGDIIMSDGYVIKDKLIRYNRYYDELIWLREKDYKSAIVDKETVSEFIIYDKEKNPYAHFKKIRIKNWYEFDSTDIYFHVLAEGDVSLYAFRRTILISNRNEVYEKDEYYLIKGNDFLKIDPRRFRLLRALPEHKSRLRQIIRKNRLKVKNEPHLIKAILLLNESLKPGNNPDL
jgi:hypothetical protein